MVFSLFPNNDQWFDSYTYALNVRDGVDLFHPHHLLYNVLGYLFYNAFKFTGIGSLKLLSFVNSIFGVFTLVLIFLIVKSRKGSISATLSTLIIGFLYSFWYYSTSVEVNMPALMFLFIALYLLTVKPQSRTNTIAVYIFISVGVLFHQLLILSLIPIFIYDIKKYRSFAKPVLYVLPGFGIMALTYIVIGILKAPEKSINGLYEWLTLYSHYGQWGKIRTENLIIGFWGITKTIFGGDSLRRIFYDGRLSWLNMIYCMAVVIVTAGIVWLLLTSIILFWRHHNQQGLLMLGFIFVFGVFAFWWAPSDDGFWLFPVILVLLFAFGENSYRYQRQKITNVVLILLLAINIGYEIIPASQKENSIARQGASALARFELATSDLVLTNFNQIRLALDYHHRIKVPTASLVYLESGDKDIVISNYQKRIKEVLSRGKVLLFEDEIRPEPHRRFLYERFSPDDYSKTYSPFIPYLIPVDSIKAYGRNVIIYRIDPEIISAGKITSE